MAGGLLLLGAGGPASAADVRAQSSAAAGRSAGETYDVRARRGGARLAQASAARRGLRRALGASGVVDTDPLTGGLTVVARRDGFLTRATGDRPRDVAVSYLRGRRAAFGLDSTDIAALELTRRYASESGVVHLWWEQTYRGIPSFDQGLRANVDADGRLINIGGAPRPDLAVDSIVPGVGPREALEAAARSVSASVRPGPAGPSVGPDRATAFDRGHRASLVLFGDAQDVRLAWRVLLFTGDGGVYDAVVDAESGRLLYRASLVHDVAALAFDHYPGAPVGGTQVGKDFPAAWLTSASSLSGPNTYVHSDVDDDLYSSASGPTPGLADEIPPTGGTWNYTQSTALSRGGTLPEPSAAAGTATVHPAGPPTAGRRALSSSTSSTTSTTTCATRRASSSAPAPETSRGPTACWPRWTTARTSPVAFPTARTTPTTPTWRFCPTAPRRGCRCTSSGRTARTQPA